MGMQNAECKMQNTESEVQSEAISSTDIDVEETDVQTDADSENNGSTTLDTREVKSNRAHLTSSVPRTARVPVGALTKGEIAEIRNILGDLDDTEIQRLYKRVTK